MVRAGLILAGIRVVVGPTRKKWLIRWLWKKKIWLGGSPQKKHLLGGSTQIFLYFLIKFFSLLPFLSLSPASLLPQFPLHISTSLSPTSQSLANSSSCLANFILYFLLNMDNFIFQSIKSEFYTKI